MAEEISIQGLKQRITKKLIGLEVTVSVVQTDDGEFKESGVISEIAPWGSIDLSSGRHIPFVGISTGILKIEEKSSGKLFYENPKVRETYQSHFGEFQENYRAVNHARIHHKEGTVPAVPLEAIKLREAGIFYID